MRAGYTPVNAATEGGARQMRQFEVRTITALIPRSRKHILIPSSFVHRGVELGCLSRGPSLYVSGQHLSKARAFCGCCGSLAISRIQHIILMGL